MPKKSNKLRVALMLCEDDHPGLQPVDYLYAVMRNKRKDDAIRVDAARSLLPLLYRKQPQGLVIEGELTMPQAVQIITPLTRDRISSTN